MRPSRSLPLLRVAALPAALVLILAPPGARAQAAVPSQAAATTNPLADPQNYSFAPPPSLALPPDPIPEPHGVVTSSVGNRGAGGAAALESALPGAGNTHVFAEVGGGEATPWRHGPTVTGRDVSAGISTVLPDDTAITLQFGTAQDTWSRR